jgi:hypothetical protein
MMDAKKFVESIRLVVRDRAIRDTIANLEKPPGRSPRPNLVALSEWAMSLSESDAAHMASVIELAVDTAVFGFLCVLDGSRAIEPASSEAGSLVLEYRSQGDRVTLANQDDVTLLDYY